MQAAQRMSIPNPTVYPILFAIGFVHLLNDSMQSVVPAVFPILEQSMNLSYSQLGWIGFALSMTSSIMQPVVGWLTDRKSAPYVLPFGMGLSMAGMLGLAFAPGFEYVLLSVIFIGLGSAAFHPEGSRVAYMAAGEKRGLAQSIYQVGGNLGQSLAPLMTILIFIPLGQFGSIWFTLVAALAVLVLLFVSRWYSHQLVRFPKAAKFHTKPVTGERKMQSGFAITLLVFLVFARSWYSAGISNYFQFYLIEDYGISIKEAQYFIFLFLASGVIGTFLGGPLADRFGKRNVILFSMVGSAPFALILPHVRLIWIYPLFFIIGLIVLSSFSVTVVYAQELFPGKIGTVSGLIIGLAFGMGAIGSAFLGMLADAWGLYAVMILCSLLPVIGILTVFLPSDQKLKDWQIEMDAK
ncbi:MFS transporter [Metabacillus sp. 113a]|uniref:MFS transporter n=1 Tax=Metabacillus sp. 113a TaxID=3404706 RepID=UPI003CF70719